jgi:hypothetical protein
MICRNCGTEIAEKALICYRCGHATAEAVRRPPPAGRRSGALVPALGLVALVLAALYLGQAGTGQVPPAVPYTIAALAAVLLVWRQWRRRRGRRQR